MHHGVYHINFFQAIVIGLLQGVTELFPVSSLGHTVLVPSWIGGSWATLVRQESSSESPYLAFVVGLHLATAVVLLGFYVREWARLIVGFFRSLARRRATTAEERLAWLIVVATLPVGALGIVFEHQFRVLFAKPLAAALFLMVNGAILATGEMYRRSHQRSAGELRADEEAIDVPGAEQRRLDQAGIARAEGNSGVSGLARREAGPALIAQTVGPVPVKESFRDSHIVPMDAAAEEELSRIGVASAFVIGAAQVLALLAGISREGVAMVGGLFRGLNNENAMRFSFLLSTPVIFAAGALKVPDLLGPLGNGIRSQVIAGSLAAAATSLFAVIFLSRYFKNRTLMPFAAYSLLFGLASAVRFGLF